MASDYVELSSQTLTELKDDLLKLSNSLHEVYELMNADMTKVGEAWRDGKYEEFVSGYKPQIDKCEEIAQRYEEWCHRVLDPAIDKAVEIETTDVGGDGSSVSVGAAAAGGAATSGIQSKKEAFLQGIKRVKDMERNEEVKKGIIKKVTDPGADPNQRARVSSDIINKLLNGRGR